MEHPAASGARSLTSFASLLAGALDRFGDAEALVGESGSWSYARTQAAVADRCVELTARGIVPGTGVATLTGNDPTTVALVLALWLVGARWTPLHPAASQDDQRYILDDGGVTHLISDHTHAERGAMLAAQASTVRDAWEMEVDARLEVMTNTPRTLIRSLARHRHAGESAWLQYTGGTTGTPKGAMLSHGAIHQQLQSVLSSWDLPARPQYLAASSITHAAMLPVLPTLVSGGTVVLHRTFEPAQWAFEASRRRIDTAWVVPTMLYELLDELGNGALPDLETLVYGAAPIDAHRRAEAFERFGPVLMQMYGQTECTGVGTSLRRHEHPAVVHDRAQDDTIGRPVAGADVQILDEHDEPVQVGEVGHVCVRGPAVMDGYHGKPDESAEALRNGWLHTGDLGVEDDMGMLHLVGRARELIISGGFNVYPRNVESVLLEQPGVAHVAVVGIPHARWGEAVHAVVVPEPGFDLDPASLIAAVKKARGSVAAPKSVEFRVELPVTRLGKIDKQRLVAEADVPDPPGVAAESGGRRLLPPGDNQHYGGARRETC